MPYLNRTYREHKTRRKTGAKLIGGVDAEDMTLIQEAYDLDTPRTCAQREDASLLGDFLSHLAGECRYA